MRAGGVPCSRYQSVAEVMASPYAAERGLFETVRAGSATMQAPNPPFRMQGARTAGGVPALGEHGAEVLRRLGKSEAEIARLAACGALCLPAT